MGLTSFDRLTYHFCNLVLTMKLNHCKYICSAVERFPSWSLGNPPLLTYVLIMNIMGTCRTKLYMQSLSVSRIEVILATINEAQCSSGGNEACMYIVQAVGLFARSTIFKKMVQRAAFPLDRGYKIKCDSFNANVFRNHSQFRVWSRDKAS